MIQHRAQARRRRFHAATPDQNIKLTTRDQKILTALDHYRFLSSDHLIRLAGGSAQKILRRLRLLFDHGYVDRPRAQVASIVFGNRPMIYALGDKGLQHLQRQEQPTRRREQNNACTNYFIHHALETARFLIELEIATAKQSYLRLHHQTETAQNLNHEMPTPPWPIKFKWWGAGQVKINLTPDGLFALAIQDKTAYFALEIDRGTEPIARTSPRQSSILKKFLAFKTLHEEKVSGLPNLRVLFVTTSHRRIAAMIDAIPDGTPNGLFLFATSEDACADPLAAIWQRKRGHKTSLLD